MTSPKVSQEAREAAAARVEFELAGGGRPWHPETPDIIRERLADNIEIVQSFAQFEQLIRSKVIDEAAGVLRMLIATDEEAAPNGIMDCIDNDGHPYQSAAMAGIITHARLIAEPYDHASSIRQLGERGR